jgi:bifunctional DNA-binding transcriptional regulator/antitoxin component of YhaV-PrlF toxin-antitoxin module
MSETRVLSRHRQITLPAALRKSFEIKGGDVIGSHKGQ